MKEKINEKAKKMILNDSILTYEDKGWFIGKENAVLYEISLEDYSVSAVAPLPVNQNSRIRASQRIIYNKGMLYILPDRAKKVLIYDISGGDIKELDLPIESARPCILNGWVLGDLLYCYLHIDNEIASINVKNGQLVTRVKLFDSVDSQGAFESVYVDNKIYFISRNDSRICEFDPKNNKATYYCVCKEENGFNTIAYDYEKKAFYLTGYAPYVYMWSKQMNEAKKIPICGMNDLTKDRYLFFSSHIVKHRLFLVPYKNDNNKDMKLVLLDTNSFKVDKIKFEGAKGMGQGIVECVIDERILVLDPNSRGLYEINGVKQTVRKITINKSIKKNTNRVSGEIVLKEDKYTSLEWFIEGITV